MFRIKFEQPCRVLGPDWIMSPGLHRSDSRGAILLPCEASYEGRSVEFEWPGFVNSEGVLSMEELGDDLTLRVSRSLGLLSLRDRVRDVRQGLGPEEQDATDMERGSASAFLPLLLHDNES